MFLNFARHMLNLARSDRIVPIAFFALTLVLGQPAAAERLKIGLFVDKGTEAIDFKKEFARSNDICKYLSGEDIRNGALQNFDVLVVPGGSASREAMSMGAGARDQVRRFVRDGGIYMGVCAGAYLASQMNKFDLGFLPLKTVDEEHWYRTDGAPRIPVELTAQGMEIFGIKNKIVNIKYENGPVFAEPRVDSNVDGVTSLGYFREEVVAAGGERGVMVGAPFAVLSSYGRGCVLVISPHPEETVGLKTAELHALHWLRSHQISGGGQVSVDKTADGDHSKTITTNQTDKSYKSARTSRTAKIAQAEISARIARTDSLRQSSQEVVKLQRAPESERPESFELSGEAVKLAESIFDHATEVRYCHREKPASRQILGGDNGAVAANTDCSGFISYIVHKIAPRHYRAVRSREPGHPYPQAKVWARFFDTLDTDEPHDGWLGISDWRLLRPGDLIAWKEGRAPSRADRNTGHVMMVIGQPSEPIVEDGVRFTQIPVIDSSTMYHFAPERLPPEAHQDHRDGLGMGSVRIVLGPDDKPIGYWGGTYWGEGHKEVKRPTLSDLVRFARMVPLQQG